MKKLTLIYEQNCFEKGSKASIKAIVGDYDLEDEDAPNYFEYDNLNDRARFVATILTQLFVW